LRNQLSQFIELAFCIKSQNDNSNPADYDGDGKTDAAVFRDGIWYLLQSQQGFSATYFGLANDMPIPSAYTQ
jgi:hypothetical protein